MIKLIRIISIVVLSFMFFWTPRLRSQATPPTAAPRTVALEARIIKDSTGCPSAVEIWLAATTDTIQGFEAVLQWDRPNAIHFRRGRATPAQATSTDSLTDLLKPSDPKNQIPLTKIGTLTSAWELVEARSTDGFSAKIIAVAKVFRQEDIAPILPGAVGPLAVLPLQWLPPGRDTTLADSALLHFTSAGTRFSTYRGLLFDRVNTTNAKIALRGCDPQNKSGSPRP